MPVDVLVVGGGGSGLAAAIEAATFGRNVTLIEKAPQLGGTTAWSIGSISATATPHQLACGIKDGPQGHFEDLPKFATHLEGSDNPALRRILTERVPETFRWLMGLGVEFFGPMPEPPHRQPRMHNVVPNSRAYIAACRRRALQLGVQIRVDTRAARLVLDKGRVVGVEVAQDRGGHETISAGAVVLACGDYSASPQLKSRYISETAARTTPVNPYSTGDGHTMAIEIGARVINGHLAHTGTRFVPPPRRPLAQLLPSYRLFARLVRVAIDHLPPQVIRPLVMKLLLTVMEPSRSLYEAGAVLINMKGALVADSHEDKLAKLSGQQEQRGFILLGAETARKFTQWPNYISTAPGIAYAYLPDYERSRPDVTRKAASLDALAQAAQLDPAELKRTVDRVNAARGAGDASLPPLSGPFHLLGPVQLYITFTDGGLAVDEQLRVLGPDERPIPGLYAAGSNGQGGLLLEGHGHHIGWAFTSGRLAGRNAAFEIVSATADASSVFVGNRDPSGVDPSTTPATVSPLRSARTQVVE